MNEIVNKLKERLNKNNINTKDDFKHELREITQEMIMASLSQTDFFKKGVFQGGTSLRMLYRVDRYSEDLDFRLEERDTGFKWSKYLSEIKDFASQFGISMEAIDKSKEKKNMRIAFVKDSSIEQMLNMSWKKRSGTPEKVKVKLEVDTNPAKYGTSEMRTYDYPFKFQVKIDDMASLFAGKCHAILCRPHEKGRDWFDFKWFVGKGVEPNYKYLDSMLDQIGPYKGQGIITDRTVLSSMLFKRAKKCDFESINVDVRRFTRSGSNITFNKNDIEKMISVFNLNNFGKNNSHGINR